MKYKGVTIPKNIGRPQLWLRGIYYPNSGGAHTTLRIIYPDGKVEFQGYSSAIGFLNFKEGCTSRRDYLTAVKACIDYDISYNTNREDQAPIFLGYI